MAEKLPTARLKRVGYSRPPIFDARLDKAVSCVEGEESEFHELTAWELRTGEPDGWVEVIPLAAPKSKKGKG